MDTFDVVCAKSRVVAVEVTTDAWRSEQSRCTKRQPANSKQRIGSGNVKGTDGANTGRDVKVGSTRSAIRTFRRLCVVVTRREIGDFGVAHRHGVRKKRLVSNEIR
jgi:hypothetical protein